MESDLLGSPPPLDSKGPERNGKGVGVLVGAWQAVSSHSALTQLIASLRTKAKAGRGSCWGFSCQDSLSHSQVPEKASG